MKILPCLICTKLFGLMLLSMAMTSLTATAQTVEVSGLHGLGVSHYHQLTTVKPQQNYHIFVRLPQDHQADKSYPTLYILDGGSAFPVLSAYYHRMRYTQSIAEMILVGISYGSDQFDAKDVINSNNRSRDYTAKSAEREYWGGADDFQQVLAKQIIPLVEKHYAADSNKRMIIGHSLGGQFVLYTAMQRPELFQGYIASNPALHRNLPVFLQPIKHQQKVKVFVAAASNDSPLFRKPLMKWQQHWLKQTTAPWQLKFEQLPGHDHMSSLPAAFRLGTQWLLSENAIAGR